MRQTAIALMVVASLGAQPKKPADSHVRLIHKLSQILRVTPPTKIEIEVLSQEDLQNKFRGETFNTCMAGNPNNFQSCSQYIRNLRTFIYGKWEYEENPQHFHMLLYEGAGVDVVIHEFLHWWLHHQTDPPDLLNNEATVNLMVNAIISSPEFHKWLREGS